jgi:hypothetical protein
MYIDVVVGGTFETEYSHGGISSSPLTRGNSFGEDGDETIDDKSLYTNQIAACKTIDEIIKVLDHEDDND